MKELGPEPSSSNGGVDQVSHSQSACPSSPNPSVSSRGHRELKCNYATHHNIYKKHRICEKDRALHLWRLPHPSKITFSGGCELQDERLCLALTLSIRLLVSVPTVPFRRWSCCGRESIACLVTMETCLEHNSCKIRKNGPSYIFHSFFIRYGALLSYKYNILGFYVLLKKHLDLVMMDMLTENEILDQRLHN